MPHDHAKRPSSSRHARGVRGKAKKFYMSHPQLTSFCFSSIAFGLNLMPGVHFVIVYFVNILISLLKDGLLFHFDPDMSYRVIIHDPKSVFW